MVQRVDVRAAAYERRIDVGSDGEDALDGGHGGARQVGDADGYRAISTPVIPALRNEPAAPSPPSTETHAMAPPPPRPPFALRRESRRRVVFGAVSTASVPRHMNDCIAEEKSEDEDDEVIIPARSSSSASLGEPAQSSSSSTAITSDSQRYNVQPIDPHRDLSACSNRFTDRHAEESYQVYSSNFDFPVARKIFLFLLSYQALVFVVFLALKHQCDREYSDLNHVRADNNGGSANDTQARIPTTCMHYDIPARSPQIVLLLWVFAPLAIAYGLFPLKSTMRLRIAVYFLRRRWKSVASFIVLVWAIGLDFYLYNVLFWVRDIRWQQLANFTCGNTSFIPEMWFNQSRWNIENPAANGLMDVDAWVIVYQKRLISAIIMAILAVIATVAGIVSVAVKLDFRHVLFNSAMLWITTLVLIMSGQSFSINSRPAYNTTSVVLIFLCVLFPTSLTLLATYSEDRGARIAYASKVRAERINTTLKLDLSVKRLNLENRELPQDEKALIEQQFANDAKWLTSVSIPFASLSLEDVIAKNAYGDILLADYNGTPVVLKRLAMACCTPEGLGEFKVKVEMMAYLRHPNIVQFIGATFDNAANVGIVFEYLERGDVFTMLRSSMSLSWSDPLLKIATDVALGISYLHHSEPPLVHRDLKSSNLLCTTTYSCKISDFGESKRQKTEGELLRTLVGTPFWLAPEILREEHYDAQVDVYSFGVVLTELETRKDPYFDCPDFSTLDIMVRVARGDIRPTIPESCLPCRRDLIMRCLDADPKRRPKITEIVHALQNEVRQELMEHSSVDHAQDSRRKILMRHQRLNRRGVKDLLQLDFEQDSTA